VIRNQYQNLGVLELELLMLLSSELSSSSSARATAAGFFEILKPTSVHRTTQYHVFSNSNNSRNTLRSKKMHAYYFLNITENYSKQILRILLNRIVKKFDGKICICPPQAKNITTLSCEMQNALHLICPKWR